MLDPSPRHINTMPVRKSASAPASGGGLVRPLLNAVALASGSCLTVIGLYVAKSALGINLFAGHSPLHVWLYHLAR